MMYTIDLLRRIPGRSKPEPIEPESMEAKDRKRVVARAKTLLKTRGPNIGADMVRVREDGGHTVFLSGK
jgi:hypothetical protein